ncbi:MAG: protein kinase, partial [Verrucomicrobiae bacterium]|nr:protein kinase [Verrucomicrobiae bacterium]
MLRCIGRGAFGEVWLARTVMGGYRAVKVVYRDAFEHERPFEREFEGIQRFEPVSREHPSQIAILHVGRNEEAGCFYYVMELADDAGSRGRQSAQISPPSSPGTTLAPTDVVGYGGIDPDTYLPRTLKYEQHQRGRLPVDEVLRLGTSLATALDHLHRHGLVHRDIKPSNIIFVNGVPKLADVGLVATVEASLSVAGTPGYMPPEGAGTPKGDLYSLGKVLYELATGKERQAFPALPRAVLESGEGELLRELSAVLDKACDGDPTRRYDSAAEMHADLAMIRGGRSVRRSRWLERRQKTLIRGFTTLLVAALVSTGGLLYWRETAQWANTTLENQRKTEIRLNEALGSSERASAEKEDALTRLRMAIYAGAMREAFYAAEGQRWPEVFRLLREQVPTNGGTDLRGWEWRYLEGVARQLRGKEMHHWSNGVFSIAVAPNQESIALGFGNGSIGIWTPDLQNNIADLGSPVGGDATVTFSPNGDHLYAVGSGGGFAAWQWRDDGWTCVTNIPLKFKGRHGSSPLVIQPDGKAAFLSDPGSARDDHKASPPRPDAVVSIARLDLTSFAMSTLPMNHMEDLYAVAVSPLGRWLASGGGDNRVHLLDLTQLEAEPTTAQLEASTADLCFVGEDRLVVADWLGFVRVLSLPELEEIVSRKSHENGVTAVAYDPNSGRLLSTGLDGSLRALDLEAANEGLPDVVGAVEGQAQALAVLPKGRGVLVADQAGGVMRFGSVVAAQGLRPEVMVDPWWGSHWGHA